MPPETKPTRYAWAIRDAVGFCGAAALSYGAWLAWHPAGFMVGGAFGIALAWLLGARAD
jgi:hypothetical protein